MELNYIQQKHADSGYTYLHLSRIVNTILRSDFKSKYSICERTLRRYSMGAIPKQSDVQRAIAIMCNTTPEKLIQNLKDYKAQKRRKVA